MEPSKRLVDRVAKMDLAQLERLRGELLIREEKRRVKFSRTRGIKDGEDLRRTRAELGHVRTQIRIRYPLD